jgi:hypothetical protein
LPLLAQEREWAYDSLDVYDRELQAMQEKVDQQKELIDTLVGEGKIKDEQAQRARRFADEQLEATRQRIQAERELADIRKAEDEATAQAEDRRNALRIRLLQDGRLSREDEREMDRLDLQIEREKAQRAQRDQQAAQNRVGAAQGAVAQAKASQAELDRRRYTMLPDEAKMHLMLAGSRGASEAELQQAKAAAEASRRMALAAQASFLQSLADVTRRDDEQTRTRQDVFRDIERSGGFLATRLGLLVDQDPAKQTAQNTRELVRLTKKTVRNAGDGLKFT